MTSAIRPGGKGHSRFSEVPYFYTSPNILEQNTTHKTEYQISRRKSALLTESAQITESYCTSNLEADAEKLEDYKDVPIL